MTSEEDYCCERMKFDLERVCKLHPDRFECPDSLVAQVRGGYGLIVHDGGSSVIEIKFCPFCGTELPSVQPLTEEL